MRFRRPVLLLLLVPALLASSCSSDDDGAASTTTASPSTTTSGSSAVDTTTAPDATSTTVPDDATSALVLRGDGLGLVALGAAPDAAVAAVTADLGAPTADSGWEPSFSTYGTCPGEQIRGVEWEGLVLLFTDGETPHGDGEHLFSWRVTGAPPALGTVSGLGFGATVADAEELYPGAVEVVDAEEPFPGFLVIDAEGGPITAFLEGDVITNLEAGAPCGE